MSGLIGYPGSPPKTRDGRVSCRISSTPMEDANTPRIAGRETIEIMSFCVLAVAATAGFALVRKNPNFRFAASAFFQQCQLAFWVLIGKGVSKRRERDSEDLSDVVVKLAYVTTQFFKLPLFAAQSCHLAIASAKPVPGITAPVRDCLAVAPLICVVAEVLYGNRRRCDYLHAAMKATCLAAFFYTTHRLGNPTQAWVSSLTLLAEELSRLFCPRSVTVALMAVSDCIYFSWLLEYNKA